MTINDLLKTETNARCRVILEELKKLNKKGYQHMLSPYSTFKPKYHKLQKTQAWSDAKRLLQEYHLLKYGMIMCTLCGKYGRNLTLHHKHYDVTNLFSPENTEFVHASCHSREHDVKKN